MAIDTDDIYAEVGIVPPKEQELETNSIYAEVGIELQEPVGKAATAEKTETKPWYLDAEGQVDLSKYDPTQEKKKTVDTETPEMDDQSMSDPEYFDTGAVREASKGLVYEEQVNNVELIEALKRRFGDNYDNEELVEKWAAEQHWINYNLPQLTYDAATISSLTAQEKTDYLLMMTTWDKVDAFGDGSQSFWDQLIEIGKSLAADPTTYVGLGTLGIGLAGKAGGKAVTKESLKAYLRDSVKAKVGLAMVEGGAYTAADDVARQTIEQVGSGKARDFSEVDIDETRTAVATGVGAVTAGGVTYGADKLLRKTTPTTDASKTQQDALDTAPEPKVTEDTPVAQETLDAPATKPEAVEPEVPTGEAPAGVQAAAGREVVEQDFDELPKPLKGARPTYKKFQVKWANDLQKAVYIASNRKNPSKRQPEYMKFAEEQLGMSAEEIYKLGDAMRAKMENDWAKQPDKTGGTLEPKFDFFPEKKIVDKPVDTPEPKVEGETPPEPELTKPLTKEEEEKAQAIVDGDKKPESTLNRDRNQSNLTEEELDRIEAELREDPTVQGNDVTFSRARKKVVEVTKDEKLLGKFLDDVVTATTGLTENMVAVRMLLSSVQNRIASKWNSKMTPKERMEVFFENPQYFRVLETLTKLAQRQAQEAGRALQAHSIEVNLLGDIVDRLTAKNKKVRELAKDADKAGLEGAERLEFIKSAFTDKEWKQLEKTMEELVSQNEAYRKSLHNPLPAFERDENIFTKFSRVVAEIWTSANLFNTGTQIGAMVGTGLKRFTMKGESYMQYIIGKGAVLFGGDPKAHLRWRQVQELNTANWAQTHETWKMVTRLFTDRTGEGVEAQIQRESLDGWTTKWDNQQTKGAINSDYLGFQDPNTLFKSLANKLIDGTGVFTRGSFTALTLMDDMMKRVYYRPFIRMKAAGLGLDKGLSGKDLDLFINKYDEAYTLFYQKKGKRENTKRIVMAREMEEFKKNNPDADDVALLEAEVKANEKAEAEIAFTKEERELLDEVGIDDKLHNEALEYLREMLFQTELDGPISDLAKSLRDVHPLMQTQLPYLKTVMNMTKDTFRRIPGMNLALREVRADLAAGGAARDKRIAEMMMGMAWMSSGYLLFKEGYITPSTDPSQYGVEDTTNLKGSSINVPGLGSIPLNRIEPIGSFFRLTADYAEIHDEYTRIEALIQASTANPDSQADLEELQKLKDEWMVSFVTATSKVFAEKSGAESIRKLMQMMENPGSDSAQQYFNQLASGVVPARSGIQQVMQGDVMYEAKSFAEHFRKQLGIQSEKYGDREKIDLFGLPNVEVTRNAVNWRTSNPDVKDAVEKEIWTLKPNLKMPDNVVTLPNGVRIDLDYKEHYEIRKLLADPKIDAKGKIQELMNDPRYKKLPDGIASKSEVGPWVSKTAAIENVYRTAKKAAKALYISRNKEFLKEKYKGQIENMRLINESRSRTERTNIFEQFAQ